MKKTLLASMFGMLVSVSGCQAQDATSDSFRTENGTEINIFCIKHGSVRMQIGGKWAQSIFSGGRHRLKQV